MASKNVHTDVADMLRKDEIRYPVSRADFKWYLFLIGLLATAIFSYSTLKNDVNQTKQDVAEIKSEIKQFMQEGSAQINTNARAIAVLQALMGIKN